jgi:hypothetical protein
MLKKDKDKKEDKKKKPKGSSKLDIFKSYGKYDGKPVELKTGGLTGGQVKLDKNKDGKISGEDFKMMKRKRGGSTPGLKDYVKKSDSKEKMIKVIEDGITKFVKRSKVMDNPSKYTPAPSSMNSKEKSKGGSPFRKAILERANKRSPGERFSEVDIEFAKQSLKRKRGGATRKHPNSPKGQNPISEYDKKGKLKYTAANQGGMMAKSTRGYGAARTSGMGLQDEQVKPGKVKPVKAVLGALALGIAGKKLMDKKGKKMPLGLGAAALLTKKKKEILGKKTGGPISGPKGGLPRMSDIDKDKIGKLKQQLNRFRNTSTKGGGADESKRMSDKTKQTIKKFVERIGRLTPAAKIGSDAGKRIRERLKKKIMTPAKKMGGGMMMKQYNKGGSVTASCKLGRNKATKLY